MADTSLLTHIQLGIPSLDEQHEALAGLLNALQLAIVGRRQPDEIQVMADTALAAARAHFRYEEALGERSAYPARAAHQSQHAHLLDSADRLTRDAITGCRTPEELSEAIELLRSLFLTHVARDDQALAMHLRAAGLG